MGFWVGVVADTGIMAKVAGNYATVNYTFDSPKNNEWFYFTAVFAENGSTNASTTGRGEREKRFYGDGKCERRRTAF